MFSGWKSLLAGLALGGAAADFIVLDVSPGDHTCAQSSIEVSVMIQTDHCLKLPSGIIPAMGSYMITSCSPTGAAPDTISISLSAYGSTDCSPGGLLNKDFTFDTIPSSCFNGTQVSCQTSDPYAVTQNWPAFGLYVDDATCAMPTLLAAFAPNCNTYSYGDTDISTDLTCDEAGASFSIYGTNSSIPYNGCSGTPSERRSMTPDQCTSFATVDPIDLPDFGDILDGSLKDIFSMLQLDKTDLYYYADCGGGNNIPGIETNSNSDNDSGSSDSIDGGMLALYSIIGGIGGVLLIVGGFMYMKRKPSSGNDAMNEDLLESDNSA